MKKFKEAKDDLTKAKNQQLVAMEIEAEINSLNRNMQGKYSDDEQEEEEDYGGIGGIGGGIGGIGGGIGGIGDIGNGSYSFTTFSNNHYPKLPVRNMTFETWLKDKNKKRSIDYLEGGILYPVPSKKPQYRIFNDQEILDMALIWLDCDVFEKIVSLNVCDLEQQKKEYKGATYINQLSTGILSSGFKYEFNINKFNRLITCLCEADVYMESIDHNDKTPLANAITANLTDIANILLKYGADINNGSVKMAMDENKNKTQWVRTSLGALRQNCLNAISEITSNLYQINQTKIYETILNYTLSQYAEDSSVDEVD